jgi:hypothetical protein
MMAKDRALRTVLAASLIVAALLIASPARADDPPVPAEAPPETPTAAPVIVDALAPPGPSHARRPNVAMVVGGGVSAAAGALALLIGAGSFVVSGESELTTCHEHTGCDTRPMTDGDRAMFQTMGWVGLAAGAALAGTGITLIVYGLKERPDGRAEAKGTLGVFATPREAGVRLTF